MITSVNSETNYSDKKYNWQIKISFHRNYYNLFTNTITPSITFSFKVFAKLSTPLWPLCNGVRIEEHNNRAGLVVLKPHVRPQPFVPGSARGKNCNEFGTLYYYTGYQKARPQEGKTDCLIRPQGVLKKRWYLIFSLSTQMVPFP